MPTGIENKRGDEVLQQQRMLLLPILHFPYRCGALMLLLSVGFAATSQGQTSRSAVTYFNRAYDRYVKGDKGGAIADFDIAIKFDPRYAAAYYNRGAVADFGKAIAINPRMFQAYNNRGAVRMTLGDTEGAIADYDKAVAISPRLTTAYNSRGIARSEQGRLDEAISDFNRTMTMTQHTPALPDPQKKSDDLWESSRSSRLTE